ncbi:hypothetical protein TNCV_884071 [Trichonephila clavipes]|nr:hypothetical protein TNCV_884071 [Trichonephila clavipes]
MVVISSGARRPHVGVNVGRRIPTPKSTKLSEHDLALRSVLDVFIGPVNQIITSNEHLLSYLWASPRQPLAQRGAPSYSGCNLRIKMPTATISKTLERQREKTV